MGLRNKIAQYNEYKNGVSHCTFNPEGPGVVRIHLVPPKFRLLRSSAYIVILNGYYLLPIGYSWALILSNFMAEVNKFDGKPITGADEEAIAENTVRKVRKIYPSVKEDEIRADMDVLLHVLFAVARGDDPQMQIEKLSIRAYGKNMTAPHRMDLMVSAMTDGQGKWQCNQKCVFCYAAGQQMAAVKELTTEQWKQAIDRLEKARVPMVTFTGGEPTQRSDIAELVGYAKRMVTRLNTNGVNLTAELVRDLKAAGLDSSTPMMKRFTMLWWAVIILRIPFRASATPWRRGWTSASTRPFAKRMRTMRKLWLLPMLWGCGSPPSAA